MNTRFFFSTCVNLEQDPPHVTTTCDRCGSLVEIDNSVWMVSPGGEATWTREVTDEVTQAIRRAPLGGFTVHSIPIAVERIGVSAETCLANHARVCPGSRKV